MNLDIDENLVRNIVRGAIAGFDTSKDETTQYSGSYDVDTDFKMAFRKYSMDAKGDLQYLTVGINRNRSKIFVRYKGGYTTQETTIVRPWFFGRKQHNNLLKDIRRVVWEIKNADAIQTQQRHRKDFLDGVRSMVPGALEAEAEKILIGSKDD